MSNVNHEWLPVLTDLSERNVSCILITVMDAKGSTPREAGTKMIVTADAQFGTIGGGNLEFQAIGEARTLLAEAGGPRTKNYPLGPKLAQCCGGAVTVFLEPFVPVSRKLLLFGAGHVGREIIKVLDGLPVQIRWIDSREAEFPAMSPRNCEKVLTATPAAEIRASDENTFIIIMTHSHDIDLELTQAALERGRFAYLGLIGSQTKRAKFEARLKAASVSAEKISRMTCPIGIGDINGKHPREIAISVAAELLSLGLTRTDVKADAA